jgi:transcriptional regulator with XRE-family HTH domain
VKAKEIGATVRAIRTELGLTTTSLAKKVGISQAQISRLENGEQGFRSGTLVKIAKVLRVPAFRLFMTDAEWGKWTGKKKR